MRLMKKLGVDARWFVVRWSLASLEQDWLKQSLLTLLYAQMKPDPKVYEITKRKFHNVLQGVSKDPPTDADKKLFERWSKINLERYFKAELLQADVIVLDDPQGELFIPIFLSKSSNPTSNRSSSLPLLIKSSA